MNIWRFPYYINKLSLVQIGLQLFKWGHFHIFSLSYNLNSDDLWPWYMTFDCMNIWRFAYYINKPSLVQIGLQLFKWGHFHIVSLSYNLTSDDLWPWYMNFDLINKWGLPSCIYDPTLIEIRQSMWKIEPKGRFMISFNFYVNTLLFKTFYNSSFKQGSYSVLKLITTQGNYATVGSAIVAIAIVGRGGWAGLSSTVAI